MANVGVHFHFKKIICICKRSKDKKMEESQTCGLLAFFKKKKKVFVEVPQIVFEYTGPTPPATPLCIEKGKEFDIQIVVDTNGKVSLARPYVGNPLEAVGSSIDKTVKHIAKECLGVSEASAALISSVMKEAAEASLNRKDGSYQTINTGIIWENRNWVLDTQLIIGAHKKVTGCLINWSYKRSFIEEGSPSLDVVPLENITTANKENARRHKKDKKKDQT